MEITLEKILWFCPFMALEDLILELVFVEKSSLSLEAKENENMIRKRSVRQGLNILAFACSVRRGPSS